MKTGDLLLNYEILALLGKGGFGNVYLARDVNLDVNVAVKVMQPVFSASDTMLYRLRAGARAAARLKHSNIQTIHFLGRDPVTLRDFVVMEYLAGGTLRQRIGLRPLPYAQALEAFSTICEAIDFAHRHGVVHRDLKPSNIMFDENGKLVVTDFDLARITGDAHRTEAGQALGTLLYVSPEQARGDAIDHRTDIYSLGVILFELLTGRWPFISTNDQEILKGHLQDAPPLPSSLAPTLPAHLDDVVLRALAKAPAERYETAWQLACAASGQPYVSRGGAIVDSLAETAPMKPPPEPAPRAAPAGVMVVTNGPRQGRRYTLQDGAAIGYGPRKNHIHVNDDFASRAHARVDRTEHGYTLMDLKSTNGTTVNGARLQPYTPVLLAHGDLIEIGSTLFRFEVN